MAGFSRSGGTDRSAYGRVGSGAPDRSAYGGGAPPAGPPGGYAARAPAGAGFAPPPPSRKPVGYADGSYADEKASYGGARGSSGGGQQQGWIVVKSPEEHILSNCIVVNAQEWGSAQYVLIDRQYAFTAV